MREGGYVPPEVLKEKINSGLPRIDINDPKAVAQRNKLLKEAESAYGFGGPDEYEGKQYPVMDSAENDAKRTRARAESRERKAA